MKIHVFLGYLYLILLLSELLITDGSVFTYTQAYLIGYCISSDHISPIPIWAAAVINTLSITIDNSRWLEVYNQIIVWLHFLATSTTSLISTRDSLMRDDIVKGFDDLTTLSVVIIADLVSDVVDAWIVALVILGTRDMNASFGAGVTGLILSILRGDLVGVIVSVVLLLVFTYRSNIPDRITIR